MRCLPLLLLLLSALSLSEGRRVSRCELRDRIFQYYEMPLEYLPRKYKRMVARVVCEVERHFPNSSSRQEDEDDKTDLDHSTITSPTTDLSEPSTFSAGARKRRQLQTATAVRSSTTDLPDPSAFSPTTASESDPERNPFRRQGVWRRRQVRRLKKTKRRMKRKRLQKWKWRGKPERPSTAKSARPVFTTTRPNRPTTTGPTPSRSNPPTTTDNSAASTLIGQNDNVQPVNCSDGECEVERHSLNSSLGLEDEDDDTDMDDSTTTSPTTDLSEPSTFSVRARKRIQLQTTSAARPSTADLPGASAFSSTTASESNPEWNPFRRLREWRRHLKASKRKKTQWINRRRRLKQRWRGKPGRTLIASPPRPVFTITRPNYTTTTGPTPSRPNHPTTTKPNASSLNPQSTTDNSAASTAVRRKRDVQPYKLFGVFPVHCSDDFVDGDISKEVECFAESGMIEIAYYKARGSCTSPEYLDSFFEECKDGEEGAGEDFPFEKAYGKDLLQH